MRLTDMAGGVNFDLDADGQPERIGWTRSDTGAQFLVFDRNGNGSIDDGTELFGDATPQPPSDENHGFLALAVFDTAEGGGNGDGVISGEDAIFFSLELWLDENHDGISQPQELSSIESNGITSLELGFRESRRTDEYGNEFRYISKVRVDPGHPGPAVLSAIDVFLVNRNDQ